jgi:phosphotriesterase-related protein
MIRTVHGDVPAAQLGACYAHEHVLGGGAPGYADDQFLLDDPERARAEIRIARAAGLAAMVDATPCAMGRNVLELARISRDSGIHIVAATGLHLASSYVQRHWMTQYGEAELERLFVADLEEGIDEHDYVGPIVRRTPHRAGVVKIASGGRHLSPVETTVFGAAARASIRTGAPILTHTDGPESAGAQVEFLAGAGVHPGRIILSHLDRRPDVAAIAGLLAAGSYAELDQAARNPDATLSVILGLMAAGLGDRILVGMDMGRRRYWQSYGGRPGLAFLLIDFTERLKASGVPEADVRRLFVDNPARAYAFVPEPARAGAAPASTTAIGTARG